MYSTEELQYLQMLQDNISRMAANSANCKTWMITIVIAMVTAILSMENVNPILYFVLLTPVIVFWYLDALYLRYERGLRNRQRHFLNIVSKEDREKALFIFSPYSSAVDISSGGIVKTTGLACNSSVFPVYFGTAIMVIVIIIQGLIV